MKISVQTFLVSDKVITAEDGKISVIDILDEIYAPYLPIIYPKIDVFITLLGKAEEKQKVELEIINPSNQSNLKQALEFKFGSNGKSNLVINLEGFPVTELGEYSFILRCKNEILGKYIVKVIEVENER